LPVFSDIQVKKPGKHNKKATYDTDKILKDLTCKDDMLPLEKARPVKHEDHLVDKKEPIELSMCGHKVGTKTIGVLSLNVEDIVEENERQGMDIIAVLDVSSSMSGSKISLVKDTMHFVADVLTEQDRLSIVSFSSGATRLTPLIPLGKANKTKIDGAIRGLYSSGSTNIASGMAYAFRQIKDRNHSNPITSVFLLTDGHNNSGHPP